MYSALGLPPMWIQMFSMWAKVVSGRTGDCLFFGENGLCEGRDIIASVRYGALVLYEYCSKRNE